jgi:sugar/nucleoside kinase (ribokinase family)
MPGEPDKRDFRICGVGSAIVDILARVDEDFLAGIPGGKGGAVEMPPAELARLLARLPSPLVMPGGAAANTMRLLARLGGDCALCAHIGRDEFGELFRRSLAEAGVVTDLLAESETLPTGTCLSLVTPDSERTMRTCQGANNEMTAADFPVATLKRFSHLYLDGYSFYNFPLVQGILSRAREAGVKVILDLGSPELARAFQAHWPTLLAEHIDIVLANESECRAVTAQDTLEAGRQLLANCCDLAVVKHGGEGAEVLEHGQLTHIPAVPAKAIDTTGAGDTWAAGFLYGLSRGWTYSQAGELAARLAAATVETIGAAPTEAAIKNIQASLKTRVLQELHP